MLQKLYEIAGLLFHFGKDLQQNRDDIKQLQAEVAELSAATQDELRKIREAVASLAAEVSAVALRRATRTGKAGIAP